MNCVLERRPPSPDIEDEVKALRVIHTVADQLGIERKLTVTIGER